MTPLSVGSEDGGDLVAHAAEDLQLLFLAALGVRGVVEGPVVASRLTGKDRAGLVGVPADGDHCLDGSVEELREWLGSWIGKRDSRFLENAESQRVNVAGRVGSGTGHFELPEGSLPEIGFGDLGTTGIAGAENEEQREVAGHAGSDHGKRSAATDGWQR